LSKMGLCLFRSPDLKKTASPREKSSEYNQLAL